MSLDLDLASAQNRGATTMTEGDATDLILYLVFASRFCSQQPVPAVPPSSLQEFQNTGIANIW